MELEETSFMEGPRSQNAKGFQNPLQQKKPNRKTKLGRYYIERLINLVQINLDKGIINRTKVRWFYSKIRQTKMAVTKI